MRNWSIGRWFISLIALFTIIGPYSADWNETHIYNPRWPPHAKFHNAQTMMLGTLLGLLALWFLWQKGNDKEQQEHQLKVGTLFAGVYWVAQIGASFFPGVAFVDPEFVDRVPKLFGSAFNFQLWASGVIVALLVGAYLLENSKLQRRFMKKCRE